MMVDGERLKALLATARHDVLLCAPFVKAKVLESLLPVISDGVVVRIITRWRAEEVAAGVSDLEVFEIAGARLRTELALLDELHAKIYVADDDCLVGSANLTASALGWSDYNNVELLVRARVTDEDVAVLLKQLEGAKQATFRRKSEVASEAAALESLRLGEGRDMVDVGGIRRGGWVPRCAAPEKLYEIYLNEATDAVTAETREDGLADLRDLGVRRGLERRVFREAIAGSLRRVPSIAGILKELPRGVADRRGAALVKEIDPDLADGDAEDQWRVVRDWIGVFFADEFEVAPESFVTRLKAR